MNKEITNENIINLEDNSEFKATLNKTIIEQSLGMLKLDLENHEIQAGWLLAQDILHRLQLTSPNQWPRAAQHRILTYINSVREGFLRSWLVNLYFALDGTISSQITRMPLLQIYCLLSIYQRTFGPKAMSELSKEEQEIIKAEGGKSSIMNAFK